MIDNIAKGIGYSVLISSLCVICTIFINKSLEKYGNCYFGYHLYEKQVGNEKEITVETNKGKFLEISLAFITHSNDYNKFKYSTYTLRKMQCKCNKHIIQYKEENKWINTDSFDDQFK